MAWPANRWIPAQLAPKDGKMEPPTSSDNEPVTCPCGRELTDPVSRARGLGPRCWRKLHGPARRTRRIPRPGRHAAPEQPELPDIDQLEIWSP